MEAMILGLSEAAGIFIVGVGLVSVAIMLRRILQREEGDTVKKFEKEA